MNDKPVVVYYRVSSKQQEKSQLGLLAQRDAVHRYLQSRPGKVVAELTEIESGRRNNRPKLHEALWLCRVYGAKLIVARLDRLARSAALIAKLMDDGLDFVAADLPIANRFTVHIIAAVAEYESKLKSERVKAALAVAKRQGRKLGGHRPGRQASLAAAREARDRLRKEQQTARAMDLAPLLAQLRDCGESLYGISVQLKLLGIDPPWNGRIWQFATIRRMFELSGERLPALRCSRRSPEERRQHALRLPLVVTQRAS